MSLWDMIEQEKAAKQHSDRVSSETFAPEPGLKGRVTVMSSSYNPETDTVEPTEVIHRYVEFDQMTPEELSEAHETLYGSKICGFFDENRDRMKIWTGKPGFDFVTGKAR